MSIFEALREQIGLAELAGQSTDLKSSEKTLRGCCPFPDHQDDAPSFHVYPDERFHCFGCRRHGDVTDLWAGVQGIEPGIEAALDLAREFGVELPERDPEAQRKAQERREKEDSYLEQARACHHALDRRPSVREWWEKRGFDIEYQERFLLGTNKGGTAATIPFWHRGRVQGLIHRKFEGKPKYRYPKVEDFPEGHKPLFIPGPVRAGAYLVEGIVDALALAALGESAVAVGGTGVSSEQLADLRRMPGPLYVLPDADEEGDKAAREWARKLYPKALLCPAEYGGEGDGDA